MRPPADAPRLRDYGRMLWRWWPVIVCATLLSAGAFHLSQQWKKYEYVATSQLFATVAGDAGVPAAFQGGRGAVSRMGSYGALATSALVATRTIDDLKLDETPADFAKDVTVVLIPGSALMNVSVTDRDPAAAVREVNALTRNLVNAAEELESSDTGPSGDLIPVDDATAAGRVGGYSLMDGLALGGAVGFILSCVAVLGYGIARNRVLDRSQVATIVTHTVAPDASATR